MTPFTATGSRLGENNDINANNEPLNAFVTARRKQPRFSRPRTAPWLLLALLLLVSSAAQAVEEYARLTVTEPFIELHSGPGTGYPVFHVVDRDDAIDVLRRKTSWFKVRTDDGKIGWVARAQLEKTLTANGDTVQLQTAALGDFSQRRWEMGLLGGIFNNAPEINVYGGYAFTNSMSVEISAAQVLGEYFSSYLFKGSLLAQPFPAWRISPFFTLGGGYLMTRPRTTLIPPEDSDDFTAHVGLGLRTYLTRRFILRAEFNQYTTFSSNDNNEVFQEWKAGFAFFF